MNLMDRISLMERRRYWQGITSVQPASLLAYWPLFEPSGTVVTDMSDNGRNGTYTAVTLGQAGIGDGRTSASFDGSTSYANVYSAGLASAFNGPAGTITAWARVANAGIWTDNALHRIATFGADANNRVLLRKDGLNDLRWTYIAGSTSKEVALVTTTTAWFHSAITWDKAADAVKVYFNGAQTGSTQTGLGTWAGSLANNTTVIGAASTSPSGVWSGRLAHVGLWSVALSAQEVASLVSGYPKA